MTKNHPSTTEPDGPSSPRPWRLGPVSWTLLTALLFVLIVLAFAIGAESEADWKLPLYAPGQYVAGSYPLFWLVYVFLPLLARDIYLIMRGNASMKRQTSIAVSIVLIIGIVSYRYVFGWY